MSKNFDFLSEDRTNKIREQKISEGLNNITSKLSDLDIKVVKESAPTERVSHTARYTQDQLANVARNIYRNKINPIVEEEVESKKKKPVTVPDTIASRANARALTNSLIGIRNGGDVGKLSLPAGPNGGNTGVPGCSNYFALTSTMSTEEFQDHLKSKWGLSETTEVEEEIYEPELEQEQITENHDAVVELEDALLAMEDISWQSIDKMMREICYKEGITPKELHKEFKSKHGMIPDVWAKEHQMVESVGWFPLDEMVRINQLGQVYEVTFLFRGGRQRLKFFWPEVGRPTRESMQKACEKFWPGAKLLAFYPSIDPGDNQYNQMVILPAMSENFEVSDHDVWDFMSEEDTEIYDEIASEVGEPISPVYLTEDEDSYEVLVSDHDTGEEKLVVFGEGKNLNIKQDKFKAPKVPAKKKPYDKIASFSLERPIQEDMREDFISEGGIKSGHKRPTEDGAGLTPKGINAENAKTGGNLQGAVTTPPSELEPDSKPAKRRRSFCARSRKWKGKRGKAARKRWNCNN